MYDLFPLNSNVYFANPSLGSHGLGTFPPNPLPTPSNADQTKLPPPTARVGNCRQPSRRHRTPSTRRHATVFPGRKYIIFGEMEKNILRLLIFLDNNRPVHYDNHRDTIGRRRLDLIRWEIQRRDLNIRFAGVAEGP